VSSRWLLACGVAAGPLFVLGSALARIARTGYSWQRHPISSLALGPRGWIQSLNFVVSGLLLLAFVRGLDRAGSRVPSTRWGARLLDAAAVLLIAAGFFATEPVSGYPPGTPARPTTYTIHGAVHLACAVLGFIVIVGAMFVFARAFARRGERGWTIYSAASGVLTIAAFALTLQGISQKPGWVAFGGLFERVAFVVALAWLTAIASGFLRRIEARA
jgi:hypothetical protein